MEDEPSNRQIRSRDRDASGIDRRSYLRRFASAAAVTSTLGASAVGTAAADDVTARDIPSVPLPLQSHRSQDLFTMTMSAAHQQTTLAENKVYSGTDDNTIGALCKSVGYGKAIGGAEIGVPFRLDFEPEKDLEIVLDVNVNAELAIENDATSELVVSAHLMKLDETGDPLRLHEPGPAYVKENTLLVDESASPGSTGVGRTTVKRQYLLDGSEGNKNPLYLQADQMSKGDVYRVGIIVRAKAKTTLDIGSAHVDCNPEWGISKDRGVRLSAIYLNWAGDSRPPEVDGSRPTDPDGDGLYEDLSGNGEIDTADVTRLFQNRDDPAIADYPEYYDFSGNGEIDVADAVELFDEV